MELLLDGHRGIYIPRDFQEVYGHTIQNPSEFEEDLEIIKNPNHEWYWDAWTNILDNAKIQIEGKVFTLHQNDDLWALEEGEVFPED